MSYGYDARDRLTSESSTRLGGYSQTHAYDAAGNPTTLRGAARGFDADNRQTSGGGTYAYDGNGAPTTYRGSAAAYDPEGRATSMGLGSGVTAGYRADGLRAWKGVGGTKTYYLYDGGEPVLELDASGAVRAENVFAPDGLVARETVFVPGKGGETNGPTPSARAGETQYCFDAQGSVAQRLDSSGGVVSSSVYDAYGQESSTTSVSDPWGFNGRWGYVQDRETGLSYCQNRYYDPANGRWLTRDPIGFAGGINLYGYCEGGPVGADDPDGLKIIVLVGGDLKDLVNRDLKDLVNRDLTLLRDPSSPTYQMMCEFDNSDEEIYIDSVPDNPGHRVGPWGSLGGASPNYYDNTKPGARGGRHIFYDPRHTGYGNQGDGLSKIPFPPDVVLAHELGHRDPKNPDKTKRLDPQGTPVVGPNDNVGRVENPYRAHRRLPRRAYYWSGGY